VPRPMIGTRQQQAAGLSRQRPATTGGGKLLMQPRSRRYLDSIRALDARTSMTSVDTAAIADELRREFEEKWAMPPLGYVAHCYLGPPYEVHTLTDHGDIIEHYPLGQALPAELERARPLATEHYLCIEVYADRLVAVLPDGSVALMEGKA
jgi:hypothetical protein